jgi:hypothetical protein
MMNTVADVLMQCSAAEVEGRSQEQIGTRVHYLGCGMYAIMHHRSALCASAQRSVLRKVILHCLEVGRTRASRSRSEGDPRRSGGKVESVDA